VTAQKAYAGIASYLQQWETPSGLPAKIPYVADVTNEASDIADGGASAEVEPTITSGLTYVDTLDSGYILVSPLELQDSEFPLESYIEQRLLERVYRKLSAALISGGTNIASVLTMAASAPASSAQTSVAWSDLTNLMAQVDEIYQDGAVFTMNQNSKFMLAAMVDTLGRPLMTASAGAEQFDSILGKKIVVDPNRPNMGAGTVGAIGYGNYGKAACLRTVSDMHLFRLTERFLIEDGAYALLIKARFGNFATGANTSPNPIVNLVNHS
jgi:HK97 family phage major capsid protein